MEVGTSNQSPEAIEHCSAWPCTFQWFTFKTHQCHVFNHNPPLGECMYDKIIHFSFDSVTSTTSSSFTPSFPSPQYFWSSTNFWRELLSDLYLFLFYFICYLVSYVGVFFFILFYIFVVLYCCLALSQPWSSRRTYYIKYSSRGHLVIYTSIYFC